VYIGMARKSACPVKDTGVQKGAPAIFRHIIHNTGGWIWYYFVLFGLQPEPEPEASAAVWYHYLCPHVRVGLCGIFMCAEIQNDSISHDR
jgi:hypothetical protein